MNYVSNAELTRLSVSSWPRVIIASLLLLGFGALIPVGFGWFALPLFLVCAAFVTWSLGATFFYVVTERGAGGVFKEPMGARAVFFARFIIKEAIRP